MDIFVAKMSHRIREQLIRRGNVLDRVALSKTLPLGHYERKAAIKAANKEYGRCSKLEKELTDKYLGKIQAKKLLRQKEVDEAGKKVLEARKELEIASSAASDLTKCVKSHLRLSDKPRKKKG